jgi:hypothetical protein
MAATQSPIANMAAIVSTTASVKPAASPGVPSLNPTVPIVIRMVSDITASCAGNSEVDNNLSAKHRRAIPA